ncbi:AbiH family protein [Flavobacterium limnophilum]|uniref:AbiH family protein n=1 Tax=Flavobacterium limnophilum TaxID=3003262 RepID=UPI0024825810|nr:AbiH family protein [Flavobacterium limnophilum]
MSKILITGNGFDLFHHLPTKYNHFISIMTMIEDVEYSTDVSFEKLFGRVFKIRYLDEYESIIKNYNTNNIEFDLDKINRIKQLLQTNLWYKHFKNVCEIDTWIDFEMEIENVLNQLTFFERFKNKWEIRKNVFGDQLVEFTDFELFNLIKVVNIGGGFKLNEKYINQRKSSIDVKKMLEDLAQSFEEFIVVFNRYLVDIVSVFYDQIKQKSEFPFHLMNEIYTFNYTPTLEKIYNVDKSKVVYLHGEINEDCHKQNIVLGISEMPKHINDSKMFDFTKFYQKVRKKTNYKFIKIPDEKKNQLNETIFYIIGHSLDESDKEYITDLFKFLDFDLKRRAKICVFYYNLSDMENKLKNLFNIIDKEVVVNMNKENRLYFVELNEQNIKMEFEKQTYRHQPIQIR